MQVLSHEFRTPVSSLLLLLEQIQSKRSQLDVDGQDFLTRISGEAHKLERIIKLSKTYLQTKSGRIVFTNIRIESINEWMKDFIAENQYDIVLELLKRDQSIVVDPFWLKFIISNLIQNAIDHGKSPIAIRLSSSDDKLKLSVCDQGICEFKTLNEMTSSYVKRPGSLGMGLGLNMVEFITQELKLNLEFSSHPTVFSISLNQLKDEV